MVVGHSLGGFVVTFSLLRLMMVEVGPRKEMLRKRFQSCVGCDYTSCGGRFCWGWKKTIPCIIMCGRFYSNSPPSPPAIYVYNSTTTHPRVIEMSLGGRFWGFIEKVIPLGERGYDVYDALGAGKRHTC